MLILTTVCPQPPSWMNLKPWNSHPTLSKKHKTTLTMALLLINPLALLADTLLAPCNLKATNMTIKHTLPPLQTAGTTKTTSLLSDRKLKLSLSSSATLKGNFYFNSEWATNTNKQKTQLETSDTRLSMWKSMEKMDNM